MCFEGTEEELKLTANTQPAIFDLLCGGVSRAEEKGLMPDFVAGHSLGEYSAAGRGRRVEIFRCGAARAEARNVYAGSGCRKAWAQWRQFWGFRMPLSRTLASARPKAKFAPRRI